MVCDPAIGRVRADLEHAFPGIVGFAHLDGAGTLVKADGMEDTDEFGVVVRAAIAAAQQDGEEFVAVP